MKNEDSNLLRFESLSDAHRALGLEKPLHPLISLVRNTCTSTTFGTLSNAHVLNFYKISYKPKLGGKLKYGQGYYDFDEGGLLFASPNQVIGNSEHASENPGIALLIHPDYFLGYPLAKKIRQYRFFSYSTNEALHLSDEEKNTILSIFDIIELELKSRLDDFSQDVLVAQVELLLNYANRFYKRQFITRKALNNDLLQKLEEVLDDYFNQEKTLQQGIPTVHWLAGQVNMSPSYLSDMLRSLTGQNAQQHIHHRLIEKGKEKLSTSRLSVSEIAYELGFEHPQSFSKLFKTKTTLSPLEFRKSFN